MAGGLSLWPRVVGFVLLVLICAWPAAVKAGELRHYPLDSLEGVITRSGVRFDRAESSDGRGSLRISAARPRVVHLFETGDLDVEEARLIYRARLRTADVSGMVFLEMWCRFPGKGEYFSRGLHDPLRGTNEWCTREIYFFLRRGENPDKVKLNLVIKGTGTVWIDDLRLLSGPLR